MDGTVITTAGMQLSRNAAGQRMVSVDVERTRAPIPTPIDRVNLVHYRVMSRRSAIAGCGAGSGPTSPKREKVTCPTCKRVRGW